MTYYPVAGAMRIDNTLYYILKDHLGSASVVTNNSGTIQGTQRYYPFGETRVTTGTIYTDKLFTGQREMAGLGIYHYQARFYSPKLGRFLSADTIVPSYANPQSLNRYSYVLGNPLKYTDPTGHMEDDGLDSGCGLPSCTLPSPGGGGGDGGPSSPDPDPIDGEPVEPDGTSLMPNSGVTCGQQGVYSSACPGWHFYTTTNPVCPAELHCIASEMLDYFLRFAYPGQNPANPVVSGNSYVVGYPYTNFPMQFGWGDIVVYVNQDTLTSTNITESSHILYDGKVIRHAYEAENGAWYVSTYGLGNNVVHTLPGKLRQFSLASINQWQGFGIFNDVDAIMLAYILEHH